MTTIGYVPYSTNLDVPGDRRRFPFYAESRGLSWEVYQHGQQYDVVVLSSKADIGIWRRLPKSSMRIIYELVDSYLAIPRADSHWLTLGLGKFVKHELARPVLHYRSAIEAMCRRSDAIICSTEEQRDQLADYSSNIHIILDFHEEVVRERKADYELHKPIRLVWEGLPYTVEHLAVLQPALELLRKQHEIKFVVLTDATVPAGGGHVLPRSTRSVLDGILPGTELIEWNAHTLATKVVGCDVAVIPLDLSEPMSRGKPENKLLLFWRLGMPVVASASPAYKRVMSRSGIDLTCDNWQDWAWKLTELITDDDLRQRAAAVGHSYVTSGHSTDSLLMKWDNVLESIGVLR